ncbi:hypothetical protein HJTV-2_gp37 [Haloarcula virus HJTV-2]|uniref:Uncharacterized protein n=1 Tax=Haloarcula virus HJTV-2 TaxID=2877986 RepID=A0AAE8XWQ8_9CAUD|nr:hypothetical protein M1M33_gp110 [Haloarcula virus HJTV-2]UBF21657.1 hypothetical protein HJTV-2_gp37 [Haloarcula virus HJTV-2]UBF21797.1 hypothetical protein HSTV-3_gp37 [Halorubrum virus HSTV-3]UBF21926.1 hypothetical protein HJTV-3_gp37 [Haloarcula virus HJTV-3]UBF22056.1 hypothetical protein HRTV-15_gp37 [Halorubrum virus HRTV-15]
MIPELANTPPLVAWALGFFMALALKRGRIAAILDRLLPTEN